MIRSLISLHWQMRERWQRLLRAIAYATGCLSEDAAQDIILDCRASAGWYALMTITPGDVLEFAVVRHGDRARALEPYLTAACEYVSRKWDAGDDCYSALGFALDTACDYAAQDGIAFSDTEAPVNIEREGEQHDA
ncbi:MAG: hypothetical protein ACLPWS_16150 [Rhodomicrobium sp.]